MKFFVLIIFTFIINVAESQVVIDKIINIQANEIYADKLDNFYVLTNDAFIKYNLEGKKLATFNPEGGEEIFSADVRNPFKIILFFSEQNKALILDNNLTKISSEIPLGKYDIYGGALISGATVGGYWIFDNVKSQLLKLSSDLNVEYTKNINTNSSIISITDNSNSVFLLGISGGLMTFNYNTSKQYVLPIYKLRQSFKIVNDKLLHYSSDTHSFAFYSLSEKKISYLKLPINIEVLDATIGNSKIFFFNKLKVYICNLK